MIHLYLTKIKDNLLHIPLNMVKIKNIFNFGSSSIPNTTVQHFIIKIKFFNLENKIKLHAYEFNIESFHQGLMMNVFDNNYKEYIECTYENLELNNVLYQGKTIYIINNPKEIDKFNFDNIQDTLIELKINYPPKNLTNLPINLNKIKVYNKAKDIEIKVPFGCKYTEL